MTLWNATSDRTRDGLSTTFRRFADEEFSGYAPLYAVLSRQVAEDERLLELAATTRGGQLPPNMLLAAVQYLLLSGLEHPLAGYYRSITATPLPPDDAFPHFRNFCLEHEARISELLRTRSVQTNEVGRVACLLPAFSHVSRLAGGTPLALIDVGAAAGLNLLFDRCYIDYGRLQWGNPASPLHVTCELRGDTDPPLEAGKPVVAHRIGLDLNPIDVLDPDEVLWLRSLIWPEQPQRTAALAGAIELARQDPPPVLSGDAVELLPRLIEETSAELTLCVYHSFVLGYLPAEARDRFQALLADTATRRPLYFVEMNGTTQNAYLRLTTWSRGKPESVQLGECAAHGQWLRWLA